ncbi:MAG: hypothetical protein JWP91_4600 [Fibrobacteres bacterium]|nr:hypothetical protein [Fibrobacterota bacterium]
MKWGLPLLLIAACGHQDPPPPLGDRLQGNWRCEREYPEGEFQRADTVALEINSTSIRYSYRVRRECRIFRTEPDGSRIPSCLEPRPEDRAGYFEGVFRPVGDSLVIPESPDTLAFRDVSGDAFVLGVGGLAFPMTRNR